jgi:cell division protein FtsN
MTELSREALDDGFHEIHLSGKQLVFLFMVATCVLVVSFLCGVFVGRGVRAARADDAVEIASATPPSQPAPVADAGPPAAEPPAPPSETPDALSYHKRLQGSAPAAETLKKPAAEPPPVASARTPPPQATPPAAPPAAKETPQARPEVPAAIPSDGKPGKWYVQVLATKDSGVAQTVATRLAGKGYPTYLIRPAAGEVQAFYRVRVGRYDDHNEAEAVKTRIAKEEQFQPFINTR